MLADYRSKMYSSTPNTLAVLLLLLSSSPVVIAAVDGLEVDAVVSLVDSCTARALDHLLLSQATLNELGSMGAAVEEDVQTCCASASVLVNNDANNGYCSTTASNQYMLARVQAACAVATPHTFTVPETCPLDCTAKRAAFFAACDQFIASNVTEDMMACCQSQDKAWDYLTDECYCDNVPTDMPRILSIEHACRAFNGLVPGYGSNFTIGWPDDNYLALGSKCITNTSRTNPYTVFDPVVTETLGEARLVTYVDGCVAYEQGGDPTEVHAYSRSRTYDQDGDMMYYYELANVPGIWGLVNLSSGYGSVNYPSDSLVCNDEPCWLHQPNAFGQAAETCSGHGECIFEPPYNRGSWRCSCDKDYIGEECQVSTVLAMGDSFDGGLEVAIPGQFPSLRAALANTPANVTRIFRFSPGTYTGADNVLGTATPLTIVAGLKLISTGNAEDTIFDCEGEEGGFLAMQNSINFAFSMEGFTLRNCTSGPSYILLAGVNSGGAIQLDNVKAFFHGMVMEHNTGELGGSMLIFNSLVRITDSEFRYNVARQDSNSLFGECSALANIASKVELENVLVHSNTAIIGSSAICQRTMRRSDGDAVMEVRNSRFWNNTINGHGAKLASGGSACCAETAVIKVSNVPTQDISVKTQLSMIDVHFYDNVGSRAVHVIGTTSVDMRRVTVRGHDVASELYLQKEGKAHGGGGMLFSDFSDMFNYAAGPQTVSLTDVTFEGNVAASGGGLLVEAREYPFTLTLTGVTLMDNKALEGNGGGLALVTDVHECRVSIHDALVAGNTAGKSGGGLHLEGSMDAEITSSSVSGNSAGSIGGGANVVMGATVVVTDSFVLNNVLVSTPLLGTASQNSWGNGAGWAVRLMASLALKNCTLANNAAYNTGGCLYLAESAQATIEDSTLDSCTADKGGGAVMMVQSHCLVVGNVHVINSSTLQGSGGGVACTNSDIRLSGPGLLSMARNRAAISGGALMLADLCNIGPEPTSPERRSLLSSDPIDILLRDNSAGWYAGAAAVGPFSQLVLSAGTSLEDNRAGKSGGAVMIQPSGELVIEGNEERQSLFLSNAAAISGGAVYASAGSTLFVSDASFVRNAGGQDGGAVYLDANVASASTGIVLSGCSFESNSAAVNGGAVYAYDDLTTATHDLLFGEGEDANTAAHGGDFSTPPKMLVLVEPPECVGTALGSACRLSTASGAELPRIKVKVVDDFGEPMETFTKPASLKPFGSSNALVQNGEAVFVGGAATFEAVRVYASPGSSATIEMQVIGLFSPVELLLVLPSIELTFEFCDSDTEWLDSDEVCQPLLLQCPAGEYLFGDGKQGSSCIPCPRNMYKDQANADRECVSCPDRSTNPLIGGTNLGVCRCQQGTYAVYNPSDPHAMQCLDCPRGGVCIGYDQDSQRNVNPYPDSNYWGDPLAAEFEFRECSAEGMCIGGPNFTCGGKFDVDMGGNRMCWRNQDGTSSIAGFVYVCPNGYQSTESVLLSVMVVSMVFVLFITMNEMVGKFVTLDVFFKNVRLLAIGSSFRLRWHKNFSEVFIFFRVALFDVDIAQPGCIFPWTFTHSMVTQLLLPVAMAAFYISRPVYMLVSLKQHSTSPWSDLIKSDKSVQSAINQAISQSSGLFLSTYPSFIFVVFSWFKCSKFVDGKLYLDMDPNMECNSGIHQSLIPIAALAVPIGCAVPLVTAYLLLRNFRAKTLHSEDTLERMGGIYQYYKTNYLMWESLFLFRVLFLVFIQVFLVDSPLVQVLLSMMLHLLTLGLHSYAQPYIDENVNHLESTLLSIVCIFTIGGTYFYSDDVEGDDKNQWSIALLFLFVLGATMTPLAVAFDVFNKRSADVAESVLTNRIKMLMEVEPRTTEDPACESEQPFTPNASRKSAGSSSSRRSSIGKGLLDLFDALEIGRSPQSRKVQPEEDVTKKVWSSWSPAREKVFPEVKLQEIHHTIVGSAFYQWSKQFESSCSLEDADRLLHVDEMISPVVSDRSDTSVYSRSRTSEYWRRISYSFPNIMLFFRYADDANVTALCKTLSELQFHDADFIDRTDHEVANYADFIRPEDLSSIVYWLAHTKGQHRKSFYKILDQVIRANGLYEPASKNTLRSNLSIDKSSTVKQFSWAQSNGMLKWWKTIIMAGAYNPLRMPKPFNPLVENNAVSGQVYITRSASLSTILSSNKSVSPLELRGECEGGSVSSMPPGLVVQGMTKKISVETSLGSKDHLPISISSTHTDD